MGEPVELLRDHVTTDEEDEVWVRIVADRRWMALTKDSHIARNILEILAVYDSGACVFALSAKKMQGPDMVRMVVEARNRMKQFAFKYQGPFIARISPQGKVVKWKMKEDLEKEIQAKTDLLSGLP